MSLKENRYDRLPASYKEIVREPVWDLSKHSSGLSIRFLSNSSVITAKWEVLNNFSMDHMPDTGIKGVDLYFKDNDEFERNLIDNPDECFDKSQTGSLTISLYEAGNLSYLFSFNES